LVPGFDHGVEVEHPVHVTLVLSSLDEQEETFRATKTGMNKTTRKRKIEYSFFTVITLFFI
jgi:hypothetical protein